MAIRTSRTRNRAFAVLAALTLTVVQLQLVAGAASASVACNGAFSGSPVGTLAITASIPTNQTIQAGQSITVTATWDTNDWTDLDRYRACWQLNGNDLDALDFEVQDPDNDGSIQNTIQVPNSVQSGDELCVRTRISGQPRGGESTQKSNTLCWTVGAAPQNPNVKIVKTANQGTVAAGSAFTYTLRVENTSTVAANNVVITDTIPASLTIGNLPAGCSANGQTVTCNIGTLAAGASVTRQIPVTTSNGSCPSVNNTGTVTATNDSNPNDNSDSESVNVTCVSTNPDVIVRKSSSANNVAAGAGFTYTLEAENIGTATANDVVITDTFPASLTIGTLPAGCTRNGQTVACSVGNLAAGAKKSVSIPVTTSNGSCPSVTNQGTVSAGNEPAGSTGNNTSNDVTTNVTCANPDVGIRKSSSAPVSGVFSGDSFAYTITVQNTSTTDVTDVTVTDTVPTGLTIDSAAGCTINGQALTCDLGTVAAGQSETITVNVTATDAACPEVTNTATVTAGNDTIASNNTSNPVTDIVNCAEPGIAVRITKTNDANGDGRYTDAEEAKRAGLDVPFRLVITNTGEETIVLNELTDAFGNELVDLFDSKCSQLAGTTLDPGESVKCLFTMNNYSPDEDAGWLINTAELCVEMDGDATKTDCDDDDSRVRSATVLGRTVTPPPTRTPPSGTAFTGSEGTLGFGLLAMALLLFGTGVMYAGYRKRQRFDG
ncbi:MAG TPA: DUF11 domain-containing protein [Actinomycetota bacterium]|nr:DUF11 domain-containing protein [Actinomycetota bacterium]